LDLTQSAAMFKKGELPEELKLKESPISMSSKQIFRRFLNAPLNFDSTQTQKRKPFGKRYTTDLKNQNSKENGVA
jgi:hypothetical protein